MITTRCVGWPLLGEAAHGAGSRRVGGACLSGRAPQRSALTAAPGIEADQVEALEQARRKQGRRYAQGCRAADRRASEVDDQDPCPQGRLAGGTA